MSERRSKPTKKQPYKPKAAKRPGARERSTHAFAPSIHPKLAPVLEHIGVPEAMPFAPDPFQVESVEAIGHGDVVVSAPTGSGKTWIAEQAIRRVLESGQRAWYASPLKALSNAKYHEFGRLFGPENVGILTGDRKENSQAPLIVGTTEILRNQLYDAMHRGANLDASLIVLDEAHYLGDPDRGVVWEEVIIYTPPRVRLLLLSATVENADQISRWLRFVRGGQCRTVITDQRPVPLFPVFLFPSGELAPLKGPKGLLGKVHHFVSQADKNHRPRPAPQMAPFANILGVLDYADMLPAIFFLKSRADCDQALSLAASARMRIAPRLSAELNRFVDGFVADYPFLKDHPQIDALRRLHVASHHAGHLPHWKLLVERLMQKGLLRAIFSTSTVAAGVNFPARTVVITQSDRFNGRDFVDLRATDLLQMTGRAGRRGMDNIGFALVVPGQYQNVPLLAGLMDAQPEPIESQLHINFSMVLNLLLSHRPAEVKQLLGASLATFQRLEQRGGAEEVAKSGLGKVMGELNTLLAGSLCNGPEEAVVRRKRRRQMAARRRTLEREMQGMDERQGLWAALERGRVFMDLFGAMAAVLRRDGHGDDAGVLAVSLIPDRRLQKGRPRLDFVPLDEVAGVFEEIIDLPVSGGGRVLAQAVLEQLPDDPKPMSERKLAALARDELADTKAALDGLDRQMAQQMCNGCPLEKACLRGGDRLDQLLAKAELLLEKVQEESHAFWYEFVRRLEFLRSEGFVDAAGELTQDGLWASKLRLDQPVLIAQAIRDGALPARDPVLLAALLALFVDDRDRDYESHYISQRLKDGIAALLQTLGPLLERLRQWGFDTPPMPMPAAMAMFAWALGQDFADVVFLYGGAEGDLAALIYRTADNLRQIASLYETHPALAATAREAVEMLLRPPVVVPT